MDYFDEKKQTTSMVSYKLLGADGKVVLEHNRMGCFSAITYKAIPEGTEIVRVKHEKSMVPYSIASMKRWIADINEMGFPAYLLEDVGPNDEERRQIFVNETTHDLVLDITSQVLLCHTSKPKDFDAPTNDNDFYYFDLKLKDFEYKSHFISTLMLVRCLTETGICKVPHVYFQLMDKNPGADKFQTMQDAHKAQSYGNTNHMITWDGNGKNVSKQVLFDRYKTCAVKVRDHKGYNLGQSDKWNGSNANWKPAHTVSNY